MSYTQQQTAAEAEAAARAAARAARRRELNNKIAELNNSITTLSDLKNSYSAVKVKITDSRSEWDDYKASIDAEELYTVVQHGDYFDGDTAKNQAPKLIQAVSNMQSTVQSMSTFNIHIQSQISKLETEISRLTNEKNVAVSELNSI